MTDQATNNNISAVPTLVVDHPPTQAEKELFEAETAKLAKASAPVLTQYQLDSTVLTPADKESIVQFKEKIDITNPDHVLLYGAEPQKKIAAFSDKALASVKSSDTGEIGDLLTQLVVELKGFDASGEEPKGLKRFFKKATNQIETMKAQYDTVETNVETIAGNLESFQVQLLKDVSMLEHLYDMNTAYFKELTMYIVAGEEKLEEVRTTQLAALQEKALASQDAMDAQGANDLASACDRFEKKLHDLKLTRQVSMQMAPQIRLMQNNDSMLVERIQSTLSNTLPLWKSQMVLALGLHHSQTALKAQSAVSDMTNELLKKNAETLKMGTIETAKEAERGIIDIDTLLQTNQSLIDTIDEVLRIQQEGHQQRMAAESSLAQMEETLKQKLLAFKE
ncbi:MAG: toxic anion resistance protein [Clostridiales bacterium]|nr:toxic anion resistance protein [Clostridiales bacterium]